MGDFLRDRLVLAALCGALSLTAPAAWAGIKIVGGDETPAAPEEITRPDIEFDGGSSERLALVISAQSYDAERYDLLETPAEDGDAIAFALRQLGYRVMRVRDADRAGLVAGVETFSAAVEKNSTVVVYYSGLGVALPFERDNRVIPADFPAAVPDVPSAAWAMVKERSLALDADLLSLVKRAGPKAMAVFYDACRSDPLSDVSAMQKYNDTASCKPTKIRNAAALYASAPGTASMRRLTMNDSSALSVFPRAILAALGEDPAMPIDALMQSIKANVRASAQEVGDRQNPPIRLDISAAVMEQGVCIAPVDGACSAPRADAAASPTPISDPAESAAWQACLDASDAGPCDAYLQAFPDGENAASAQRRISEFKTDEIAMNNATYVPASGESTDPVSEDVAAVLAVCDDLAAHPGNDENAEGVAGVLYGAIDGSKALPACLKAVELAPKSLRIRYQLARAKQAAGQEKEALQDLLRLAEDDRYPPAMNNIGATYQIGIGVPKSIPEAARWYEAAANEGFVPSMAILGWMYQAGQGVPKNNTKAFQWYLKAAEGGAPSAMHNVGFMYQNGWGTSQDDTEAAKWFKSAADEDFPQAMAMTGWLYQTGRGLPKSAEKALDMYRRASAKDVASAMAALGSLYDTGEEGVARSPSDAARWLMKAVRKGHEPTRSRLIDQPKTLQLETRREVQRQLAEMGFDPGPADGVFGQKTRDAIDEAFTAP